MNSQKVFNRLESRKIWRRTVSISFILLYLVYLSWRVTIINENSLILSLFYLLAEILGVILGVNTILKSWNYNLRKPIAAKKGLKVDVIIPTYKEPLDIIRKTLISAKNISYPHQTIILDDGKRQEIKELAAELDVKYFCREKNLDAKAGNLNFGLKHSDAEFFMVFDADHIPLPNAIDSMLGYFVDADVAMVQSPQYFYNKNAFQYINSKKSDNVWHEQSFYYHICQPCLDKYNIVSCIGTGVIFRRSAIDEIGGIPLGSLTEDTYTSFLLNRAGYKTLHYDAPTAYGVATADLDEYYKTRRRWAYGNIQIVKKENIFFRKGLSWRLRLFHMSLFIDHLEGWQQLILLNVPIFSLIFGLAPFEISVFNVLITFFFPFIIYAMLQEIGCGFSRLWTNEIFSMLRWPIYLSVCSAWFGKKLTWFSSSKNIKAKINWRPIYPQIFVLALSVFSLVVAFFKLREVGFKFGPIFLFFQDKFLSIGNETHVAQTGINIHSVMKSGYTLDLVIVSGMWVIYNMLRILFLIYKVISDRNNSHEFYRFKHPIITKIDGNISCALEIAEDWLKFSDKNSDYKIGDIKEVELFLPEKIIKISAKINYSQDKIYGAAITFSSTKDRDDLCKIIYLSDIERELVEMKSYFLIPSDLLLSIFCKKPHRGKADIKAFLYNQNKPAILDDSYDENNELTILTFEKLNIGDVIEGQKISEQENVQTKLKICSEIQNLEGLGLLKYKVVLSS